MSLIEVQQNSDITYRLYDYGRPRELHLDAAVAVAHGTPYPAQCRKHVAPSGNAALVEGPLFRLDQVAGAPTQAVAARYAGPLLAIPREGPVHVAGSEIAPGGCAFARSLDEIDFAHYGLCLIAQPLS
ncbi:hypothetical protein B2G71_11085 [Novosphingobium sp. PC22D]|nr:hypothetical protein B2G71_11085 [Novosphingobium sp. PC22D]